MSIFMLFIASSGNWTRIMTFSLTSMILQNIMKEVSEEEVSWCFLLLVELSIIEIPSVWMVKKQFSIIWMYWCMRLCLRGVLKSFYVCGSPSGCKILPSIITVILSHGEFLVYSFIHFFQRCHGAWLSEYSAGQLPEEGCRNRTAWATRSLCGSWYPRRINGIPQPLNIGSGVLGVLVLVLVMVVYMFIDLFFYLVLPLLMLFTILILSSMLSLVIIFDIVNILCLIIIFTVFTKKTIKSCKYKIWSIRLHNHWPLEELHTHIHSSLSSLP